MHGKILIVDAIPTNRIALKVKLAAASYAVTQAGSIAEAEAEAQKRRPDLVIASAEFPDGDAVRLARRLAGQISGVPVLVLAPGLDPADRVRLLHAGVAEVVKPPISDALLLAQVRGLLRLQASASEWSIRDDTVRALGLAETAPGFVPAPRVRLVARNPLITSRWHNALEPVLQAELSAALPEAAMACESAPDVFVIALDPGTAELALSLVSSLRAQATTRHCALLMLQEVPDDSAAARALDMGADAVMQTEFDGGELSLRINRLVQRKRMADRLRSTFETGLQAAVSDPLTGLHNRRYAIPHLMRVAERAAEQGTGFAVMVADLDHFKGINDRYGHAAGDVVLVEAAQRLRDNLRGSDMVARIGGEEFLIVLPAVGLAQARAAAGRLCQLISDTPFALEDGRTLKATISIGLALGDGEAAQGLALKDHVHQLIDLADKALYRAKTRGRNCVRLHRSAA